MKKLLLPLTLCISYFSFAQNLVQNADFSTSKKITSRSEISRVEAWSNANGGSVDVFTPKSPKYSVGIPENFMGSQESQNNYIGFTAFYADQRIAFAPSVQDRELQETVAYGKYSEYPQVELQETLIAGQQYQVSIEVSLADKSGRAVQNLGAFLSKEKMNIGSNAHLDVKPNVTFTAWADNKNGWQKLTGEFTATGGEKFLIIGAFEGTFMVKTLATARTENDNKRAYYYLNSGVSLTKKLEKDTDGDGVLDKDDECPDVYGTVNGCPDRDGDGVADKDDKCPDTPGEKDLAGCPKNAKDTDGDGFPDSVDECPKVKGTIKGCPDRDGDGIPDKDDECPDEKGRKELKGCPMAKEDLDILRKASEAIYFNSGSAVIKTESYSSLDKMAEILKKNKDVEAMVEGHTDAQGNDDLNLRLSKERAKAVKDYLIEKGVDASRLDSEGYGETKPIATNNTAEGRAKNRRVVILTSSFPDKK